MVLKPLITTWGALGFYRGSKLYNYEYKKKYLEYENRKDNKYYIYFKKPVYLYASCIGSGFFGVLFYVNPFTLFFVIPKEIYRLEVNIRGLHEEKEKDDYYKLM
jgi:hypothetical protein